jgi:hypothetical protein
VIRLRCIVWVWAPDDDAADQVLRAITRIATSTPDVEIAVREEWREAVP